MNTLAFVGAKRGIGNTVVSSLVACGLARRGHRTVLVDANFMNYSVHSLFLYGAATPDATLGDFMGGKAPSLNDVLMPTLTDNLSLLCGAGDIVELANPRYAQKERLKKGLSELEADFVVIDLGAEAILNCLDLFNVADLGIIVTTPEHALVQSTYKYIKLALARKLINMFSDNPALLGKLKAHFVAGEKASSISLLVERIEQGDKEAAMKVAKVLFKSGYRLVVNMAGKEAGEMVVDAIAEQTEQYLSITPLLLGTIGASKGLDDAIKGKSPISLDLDREVAGCVDAIVDNILEDECLPEKPPMAAPPEEDTGERPAQAQAAPPAVHVGLNNDIEYGPRVFHVQTEDLGRQRGRIVTQVFADGRVIFTKATDYAELEGAGDLAGAITERIKRQHKAVILGISSGKLKTG